MNDDDQRREIKTLLESGLVTDVERTNSDEERRSVLSRIKTAGSIENKIKVAGFKLEPVVNDGIEEACESCMYYLVRRRYCELPELSLAVEPQWSCRVWRI